MYLSLQVCSEPYLQSEYGNDYGAQSPVKLLDKLYYGFPQTVDEELVILAQVGTMGKQIYECGILIALNF
jgi:hypothetical protein